MSIETVDILLIEDSVDEADIIRLLFGRSPDFRVSIEHVTSVGDAIHRLAQTNFDIALLDLGLPDNCGVEAVTRLQQTSPQTPIFVLTGDDRRETGLAAIEAGAQDYLPKQHMVGRLLAQMTEHCIARQRRLREAERQSMIDELTGLENRRGCDFVFHNALRTRVGEDQTFAVSIIDIDKFKLVNDRYGHAAGDDVIQAIGIAASQAVGGDGMIFRYGGEEFVAFIWTSEQQRCVRVMERLRLACQDIHTGDDHHQITISLGGTLVSPGEGKREVFGRADAALYRSKEGGRDRGSFHDGQNIDMIAPSTETASSESISAGEKSSTQSSVAAKPHIHPPRIRPVITKPLPGPVSNSNVD